MGLLDDLFPGNSGGGLLDFLRNNAMNQQFGGGLPSDQAQYGSMPAPLFSQPQMSPAQPPQPMPAPTSQPAPQSALQPPQVSQGPGFGDRIGASLQSFANSGGPLPALANGITSLITGQRTDPEGIALQKTQQNQMALIQGLRARGASPQDIFAGIANPEYLKKVLDNSVKEKEDYRPATPEERRAAGMTGDNNTPMFINKTTNEPKFGPAQTNVNVSTEKTGQAELAKTGVESYVAAQNAGRDAQKRVAMYDAMEKAAQGFTPGASAEMRLTAKRYLKDAGLIKGEDVPEGEIMQMISRQLGVHAQPKGQGAVSNYERELFAKSLPNMTQSPEGLKMAIDISRKLEQHDQKVAEIYRESARANKGMPNYLEVQEKIAALGSPLSDAQMGAISGGSTPTASPAPSSNSGWTNIGNGVKIRPK